MTSFIPFPKVPRYSREVVVTEKIDGTNASVVIMPSAALEGLQLTDAPAVATLGDFTMFAGSRNRWITPEKDNYGFAGWVASNVEGLVKLGPGRHFGEWFGAGIQRGYGLTRRYFSLFNTAKWSHLDGSGGPPCSCVPVLWRGNMDEMDVPAIMESLKDGGSVAAPGFMDPEGIMIFHVGAAQIFKKTYAADAQGKERAAA